MFNLSTPPVLAGSPTDQLKQIRSYLYQMTEQLNMASLSIDNKTVVDVSKTSTSKASETENEYLDLKALIQKTADTVTKTIEYTDGQIAIVKEQTNENSDNIADLTASISSEYVAKSEYGTFQENIINQISVASDSITNMYNYFAQLEANVNKAQSSFDNYVVATEGSIKMGIVEWDGAVPIFGIAIGQDIKYSEVSIDGETYAEIDKTNYVTTYTATGFKMWQDNQVVAYISNNKLYITNAHIVENLTLGDFSIKSSAAEGFVIKYTGD